MIIDADGHVTLPDDIWDTYFEQGPLYDHRPKFVRDNFGARKMMVDGEVLPRRYGRWRGGGGRSPEKRREGGANPVARLEDMDTEGIDVAVLFPSSLLPLTSMFDTDMALAMTRAYHNWLADYCKPAPDRLKGVCCLAAQDMPRAIVELERCVTELGFVGAYIPPNVQGHNLDEPLFEPLWQACERLDVPVMVHPGPGLNAAGTERLDNFFYVHSVQVPFENMIALMTMIGGGVLDRYQKLRPVFLESGVGWVPYWAERLDDQAGLDKFGTQLLPTKLDRRPSDYVKDRCWFSCDPGEEMVPYCLDEIGRDRIVFATDYAHFDSKFPDTVSGLRATPGLSAADADRIFGPNSEGLFGAALRVPSPA